MTVARSVAGGAPAVDGVEERLDLGGAEQVPGVLGDHVSEAAPGVDEGWVDPDLFGDHRHLAEHLGDAFSGIGRGSPASGSKNSGRRVQVHARTSRTTASVGAERHLGGRALTAIGE
ncbi:hypothetical protein [Kitasatospora sp. NPDC097691]|uniref:hypothetical protein n=1 Tax=Kitasatospora sp. NPDC097691 TaxID=3157231 RepID=UPI0033187635